jgi:hypothetical protein
LKEIVEMQDFRSTKLEKKVEKRQFSPNQKQIHKSNAASFLSRKEK